MTKQEAMIEIDNIKKTGVYPIASLSIFDSLDNLNLSEGVLGTLEYTIELYKELVGRILSFDIEFQIQYLNALKKFDVFNNQVIEGEDKALISLYQEMNCRFAIDGLIESNNNFLDKEGFVKCHDLLLEGTSSQDKKGLRTDNLKYVGRVEDGKKVISYFPIECDNIDNAIDMVLKYYNSNDEQLDLNYKLLKPIICHGLIVSLQMFNDGNARYARLIQTISLWNTFNNLLELDCKLPIVYGSSQYLLYNGEYRKLISNLVKNNDWNSWIMFNLRRIQDCIFKEGYYLDEVSARMNIHKK